MNRRQYHRELKKILASIDVNNKPLLFLHICCAPCSSVVLKTLNKYFNIIGIFSNSNIDSIEEFNKRKNEVERIKNIFNSPTELIISPYVHDDFLFYVKGHETDEEGMDRCKNCIEMRIKDAINIATKCIENVDIRKILFKSEDKSLIPKDIYFTTSLTTSSRKDPVFINDIIEKNLMGTNIKTLPSDFKKDNGNLLSIELCEKYNIYRQEYCGCEFSKN